MRAHRRQGLGAVALAAALGAAALGGEAPPVLAPGAEVLRWLAGGETHRHRIDLAAGDFVRVRVEQRGIDVELRLIDAAGETVLEVDSPTGSRGLEVLSHLAAAAASYALDVAADPQTAREGEYLLTVEALRPATDRDLRLLAADEAMDRAYRRYKTGTADGYARALDAYDAARGTWRQLGDAERQAEATYMGGVCRRRLRLHDEALAAFDEALALFRARHDLPAIARVHSQIGLLRSGQGDHEAAIAAYRESLELRRQVGDAPAQASTLNNLGLQHYRAGRYRQALDHYRESLDLFRRLQDRRRETVALNNLALVYERLGEPDAALEHHRRVLARSREDGDRDLEARTLNNLGYLYRRLGEPQAALARYRAALALFEELGAPALQGKAWHNLGVLHLHLGQPERGLEMLARALDLLRRVEDRDGEAETLTQIGEARLAAGEPEAARAALDRALELRLELGDRDGEADTRTVLAELPDPAGGVGAARHLASALAIRRALEDRRGEAQTLRRLGELRAAAGDLEGALAAFADGLEISRAVRDPHGVAETHRLIGRAELSRGHLEAARRHLEAAVEGIEASRAKVLDAELRSTFYSSRQSARELHVEVLLRLARERSDPGLERAAFEDSERARARGLIELLSEAGLVIRRGVEPRLAERRHELSRRLNAKAALEARADGERLAALRREIQDLLDELRAVEVEIRQRHPGYMALLEPPRVRVEEIQAQLLGDGSMLLEYALGEERSHLWSLTRDGLESFELPPRAAIEELARTAYAELGVLDRGRRESRCRTLAELGRMLLGPVAPRLADRRLVVVPDGVLHYLPFAAFGDPRGDAAAGGACSGPPLVERHEIVTLPSAAAMLELRARTAGRAPAPRAVAVLADPVFDAGDPRVAQRAAPESGPAAGLRAPGRGGFARLPWSRREAEAIAAAAGDSTLRALDFAASRGAIAALADYRVVHFATHGVLDSRRPELSGLVLSLVDAAGGPQDGFLRLHDVYNLELGAELVVLSGCRTALGREIRGEGLVGLTRGFFHAGAARVLASLWRIDDRATAELMGHFYRELLAGGATPAAALRRAQRALRRQPRWRDPYYWAAFILQGEWRASPES